MSRRLRVDYPGALHHITNRGASHRALFETQADVTAFQAQVQRLVSDGELEVLAMCVMSTHFHLLVRSVRGELGPALQWSESTYAGRYNRTRDRDGPVFKGRYFDRPVEDQYHAAVCVAYIDRNPVEAGMVATPEQYPHGTARYYLGEPTPRWLNREYVEDLVCRITCSRRFSSALYPSLWSACSSELGKSLVERGIRQRGVQVSPIQVLVCAGPDRVQRWLRALTEVEEGRHAPCLTLPGEEVLRACDWVGKATPDARVANVADVAMWTLAAGLLHWTAGWTTREIATSLGTTQARVVRALGRHRAQMKDDVEYAMDAGRRLSNALRRVYGPLANLADDRLNGV
jgi:REP element-mobilizing transposase RayT